MKEGLTEVTFKNSCELSEYYGKARIYEVNIRKIGSEDESFALGN